MQNIPSSKNVSSKYTSSKNVRLLTFSIHFQLHNVHLIYIERERERKRERERERERYMYIYIYVYIYNIYIYNTHIIYIIFIYIVKISVGYNVIILLHSDTKQASLECIFDITEML